jgi:phenylacetate-CoA ligase
MEHHAEPVPLSSVPGITWPAVTTGAAANLIALQWQLERSERWPPQMLEAWQFRQIDQLVRHCAAHVPFWRDRLQSAGLPSSDGLSWQAWRSLPVLTRTEVNAAGAALHASSLPREHGKLLRTATSGSTGSALEFVKTELSQFFWHGNLTRELLWHEWDPAGKIAFIREGLRERAAAPNGLTMPDWGAPFTRVFTTGPRVMLDIQTPIAQQAAWLVRQNPDMLLSWPSNLAALARHCRDEGVRPDRLLVVRTVGETVTPALRALCRQAWGANVVDCYSAEEVGHIALQCPTSANYHVQSEDVLVEVLDNDDRPCQPGKSGRVVITSLHNFAMPLLRYAIGDIAECGGVCVCGRSLPTLARVIGRTRDRLLMPDGERRFVTNPSEAFAAVSAIRQYQIAQVATDTIELRVDARRALTADEQTLLGDALAGAIGHRFAVRFSYVDDFAKTPLRKFRDVVCEIETADG